MLSNLLQGRLIPRLCGVLGAVLVALAALPAQAQIGSSRYSSIVIDAASGAILSAANPDDLRFPASLTKMMTLYMLFEAVRDRRVGLNQYVPVSANAAAMSPTKLGLLPGSLITVEQAVLGLVTKSANDAACALGEMLGGDEDRFAQMMTLRARALGMTRSTFRNASGLPDWEQVTTAHDMAILARHLIQDFPGFYHYFSTASFVFQGRTIYSHQRLLQSYPGADGLKTGYIDASGFNVVTSAARTDTRLIGVVLGASSGTERDAHMAGLLDMGFERMGVAPLMARRDPPSRLPGFVSVAHAATLPPPVPVQRPADRPRGFRTPLERPSADRAVVRRAPDRSLLERPTSDRYAPAAARTLPARGRDAVPHAQPARSPSTKTAHGSAPWRYPG